MVWYSVTGGWPDEEMDKNKLRQGKGESVHENAELWTQIGYCGMQCWETRSLMRDVRAEART